MTNQDPYVWRDPWEEIELCEKALNAAISGWPKTMRQRDMLADMVEDYRDGLVRISIISVALLAALIVAIIT